MNFFKHVCLSFALACGPMVSSIPLISGGLQLNPADLEGLNLNDADSQGLNDFLEFLNNMPPEAQEELAKVGKEIDDKMRSKGLDPLNPDDIFKFMEQEEQAQSTGTKLPTIPKDTTKPEIQKQPEKPTTRLAVVDPTNARSMLKELSKNLASVRQKAGQFPQMNHKLERWHQELNDLMYYLTILVEEPLLTYITSKEFSKLYKNLEILAQVAATNEPLIKLREPSKLSEENPYDTLGLFSTATQDEIDLAFQTLKQTNSPDTIERRLNKPTISKQDRHKKVTEAKLKFSFIQDAYDRLKEPKQRALTDRLLRENRGGDKQRIETAHKAFSQIIDQLSTAFYSQKVLGDIEQLIKQHQPKELEIKKAQDALEQQAAKRLAQPVKIDTRGMQSRGQKDEFSDFYNQVRQDAARSLYAPQQAPRDLRNGSDNNPFGDNKSSGQDSKQEGGKSTGQGKAGKPEGKEKKDENKKDTKEKDAPQRPGSGSGAKAPKMSDKEEGKLETTIEQLAKNIAGIKDAFDSEGKLITSTAADSDSNGFMRSPSKITSLISAAKNAENYFTKPTTRDSTQSAQEVLQPIDAFILQPDFKDMLSNLNKIGSQVNKIKDNGALKKLWKEKVFDPHGHKIISWHTTLHTALSKQARSLNRKPPFNAEKAKTYGLDKPEVDLKKPAASRQKESQKEAASRSFVIARDWPREAHYYFDTISKALGIKEFPPKLKEQEQKDREEQKKVAQIGNPRPLAGQIVPAPETSTEA
ncbi:hypothetical protein H0X48_00380 [Candidatus Dependentiae bacterium]|nr:hypothetical protein [Candidatus Dependentiae bacterium]